MYSPVHQMPKVVLPATLPARSLFTTTFWSLRLGFLCQLISFAIFYTGYFTCGGRGLFSLSLENLQDDVAQHTFFRASLVIGSFVHLLGTVLLSIFQIFLADDAAWSRGYRAGSKWISYATLYGTCADVLQCVLYLHIALHYSPALITQSTGGGSEWLLFTFTRILYAIAAFQYGQGFFLIEVYHDQGTSAFLGAALLVAYVATGCLDILGIGFLAPGLGTCVRAITLVMAILWAVVFEDIVHAFSPALYETELTNELEAKVNYFARCPPPEAEEPAQHVQLSTSTLF